MAGPEFSINGGNLFYWDGNMLQDINPVQSEAPETLWGADQRLREGGSYSFPLLTGAGGWGDGEPQSPRDSESALLF